MQEKLAKLKEILRELDSVLIAYSGGVDSTLLASVAKEVLGEKAVAITAASPTYPAREVEGAQLTARSLGLRHLLTESKELDDPCFVANNPDRCYHCKKELFGRLREIASQQGLKWVVDGSNADDLRDYRPGRKAGAELEVRSPLSEAGLTKEEVRALSRERGLPTWDKPALACLASRFPYGTTITPELLRRIGEAEAFLYELGAKQVRVRHHGEIARIELDQESLNLFLQEEKRAAVVARLKGLGYPYVTLDLAGYRSGSMNEVLSQEAKVI
jgi:uncharacterized protein